MAVSDRAGKAGRAGRRLRRFCTSPTRLTSPTRPDSESETSMRYTTLAVVVLISGLAMPPAVVAQRADKGAAMLEAATQAELVDGNLETAIKLYQQILTTFTTDRPVVAAAWLGLGRCHEQLGRPKAREFYERVINQYSDQTREVNAARARLAGL